MDIIAVTLLCLGVVVIVGCTMGLYYLRRDKAVLGVAVTKDYATTYWIVLIVAVLNIINLLIFL